MKIINKYVLKMFIKNVFTSILVLLILFTLSETIRITNMDNKPSGYVYYGVLYILYQLPFWTTQILPISNLLGFLFFFTNISNSNELIAIKAGGININKIFMPIILTSLIMSFLILFLNEICIVNLTKKGKEYLYYNIKGRKRDDTDIYKNINHIGENQYKYIVNSYNPFKKELYGVNIDDFSKNLKLKKQIYARKACFLDTGKWKFYHGLIRTFQNDENFTEEPFKEKIIYLNEEPDSFITNTHIKIDQYTIKNLKKYIKNLNQNSINTNGLLTELYNKYTFPFSNFVIILIGIASTILNKKNNKMISFGIGLFMTFIFWGTMTFFITLGKTEKLNPIVAAFSTNILYSIISLIFIKHLKR